MMSGLTIMLQMIQDPQQPRIHRRVTACYCIIRESLVSKRAVVQRVSQSTADMQALHQCWRHLHCRLTTPSYHNHTMMWSSPAGQSSY